MTTSVTLTEMPFCFKPCARNRHLRQPFIDHIYVATLIPIIIKVENIWCNYVCAIRSYVRKISRFLLKVCIMDIAHLIYKYTS